MKIIPGIIFFIFHVLFIAIAVYESYQQPYQLVLLVFLTVLLLYFYRHYLSCEKENQEINIQLQVIIFAVLGGLSTFLLQEFLLLTAVLSAGITGLAGGLYSRFSNSSLGKALAPALYCGAFVGMTPPEIAGNYFFITFASIFAGVIYILTRKHLNGYGGKLGSIAFAGVSLASLLTLLFI